MSTELRINWIACDGRGGCVELLPEILDQDEWGYPIFRDGNRATPVPAHLERHARRAVTHCPRLALKLTSPS
jgi:ferredoxin